MRSALLALLGAAAFPAAAHAGVLINEIAWMGSPDNANAEWVELYNPSTNAVDLAGWTLSAADGAPAITLSGSISAGGFFLLERTSDASVPAASADQIYSGALGNGGETLTLNNASGTVIDTVIGGTDWVNIGGDNVSKQTAQRTQSGWTTALGTPRAANSNGVSAESPPPQNEEEEQGVATSTPPSATVSSTGGPMELLPIPTITVRAGPNRTLAANADTEYDATVFDNRGHVYTDALVTWSFGDGTQRTGASVLHAYYEPGEYFVSVHAEAGGAEGESSFVVTVIPSGMKIVSVSVAGITLQNQNDGPIDLSRWRLVALNKEFIIPGHTIILGKKSVTFSSRVTGLLPILSASLLFPNGDLAARYPSASPLPAPVPAALKPPAPPARTISMQEKVLNTLVHEEELKAPAAALTAAAGAALPATSPSSSGTGLVELLSSPWTLSFFGLLVLSGAALLLI